MKKSILLFCILGLVACNKEQVKISGKINKAEKMVLHLDEVDVYESKPVDSVLLSPYRQIQFYT